MIWFLPALLAVHTAPKLAEPNSEPMITLSSSKPGISLNKLVSPCIVAVESKKYFIRILDNKAGIYSRGTACNRCIYPDG